jgi:long-chain fatty acid transport protein
VILLFLGGVAVWPQPASGLGVRIPNQDASAIARGNAFVATADNPSALYYNPAGITQLEGHHFQAGSLLYLGIYSDHVSPGGLRTQNEHDVIAAPQLHYTFTPKNSQFSFGLGVFAPFGLGMEWPDKAPFAPYGLEGRLNYATLTPVVAWKPLNSLSIAVGPTLNYSDAKLRQSIPAVPRGEFVFRGDDLAYGFTAGVLYQPCEKVSLGASYLSATTQDYEGKASTSPSPPLPSSSRTSARLDFPQIIRGGISYRPTPNWNFELDVDWTDWETVDNLTIKGVSTIPLNWHSSFFYEAGVTRYLKSGYYVSAGYFFSEASTSERNYTPIVPDTDLHVGSLGVGHKGKTWDWALAGQIIAGPYRNVNDAAAPPVRGKYRIITPTLSLSVGYHF